jgi:hypothetical protein
MNNAEEMQERFSELPPTLRKAGMKRCHQCNGHFGLIRHKLALNHFCSRRCLNKYKTDTDRKMARIKERTIVLDAVG